MPYFKVTLLSRNVHNEGFYNFYSWPNIINSITIVWAGQVAGHKDLLS